MESKIIVKVKVGPPAGQSEFSAVIYNVVREERILHNEGGHWPDEVYILATMSKIMVDAMEGQEEAYFHAEFDGEGGLHLGKRASRREYLAGAKNPKLFLTN